ncbi:Proteasome subunit beta type-6 [Armadillidium vulgare]|nr:Proteasome subunit beta type-6 [Armadillidium vulgare]
MESFICKPKYVEGVDKSHLKQLIPEQLQDEAMTGTTIMAIEFDGGVVIGADSRTSMGAYCSNRYADKLTPVTDKIYCCRSGSSADTQAVADIVASYMEILEIKMGEPVAVQIAANTFKEICYNYRDRLTAGIIVAGWDKMKQGQEGMTKDEAVEFVKNAVTLALTRDNSSSGVVRVGIITKDGVERKVFTHDKLPQFQ